MATSQSAMILHSLASTVKFHGFRGAKIGVFTHPKITAPPPVGGQSDPFLSRLDFATR
jgi:hypothetical protein